MKPEKAVEVIEYARAFNKENTPLMHALDAAVKALEKQMPKKPDYTCDAYYECLCGNAVAPLTHYCPRCGQAIDWDTKEKRWWETFKNMMR